MKKCLSPFVFHFNFRGRSRVIDIVWWHYSYWQWQDTRQLSARHFKARPLWSHFICLSLFHIEEHIKISFEKHLLTSHPSYTTTISSWSYPLLLSFSELLSRLLLMSSPLRWVLVLLMLVIGERMHLERVCVPGWYHWAAAAVSPWPMWWIHLRNLYTLSRPPRRAMHRVPPS